MAILRIILGIAVIIGAFIVKKRATPNAEAEDITLDLMGQSIAPSSVNMLVIAFTLIGIAMIALGIWGVIKQRR